MRRLVEAGAHRAGDYFGVVSYQLRQKIEGTRESWKHNEEIANLSARDFTLEAFERELRRKTPDAMSFVRHAPHDPVTLATAFFCISRTSTDCGARNSERAVHQVATMTFTARRTTKYATTV